MEDCNNKTVKIIHMTGMDHKQDPGEYAPEYNGRITGAQMSWMKLLLRTMEEEEEPRRELRRTIEEVEEKSNVLEPRRDK